MGKIGTVYLFESKRKHKYRDSRGAQNAGPLCECCRNYALNVSAQVAAFSLHAGSAKEGIDDALIQPYSGHATRQSLEIYSRLSLSDAQPS